MVPPTPFRPSEVFLFSLPVQKLRSPQDHLPPWYAKQIKAHSSKNYIERLYNHKI